MEVHREENIIPIKKKMTEIRRKRKAPVMHNYYMNCEQDDEIFALYGENTVVFWDFDRGVCRAYFYSSDQDELQGLLAQVPDGTIIDYLTRTKGELQTLFESAGWSQLYEMRRMTAGNLTQENEEKAQKRTELFDLTLYRKDNVRVAVEEDCDAIYDKLWEVFDARTSHLCTKAELLEFIRKQWVVVYYESNVFMGFQIFKIENKRFYGYQIWSGAGAEALYSMLRKSRLVYDDLMKDSPEIKGRVNFGWIDANNRTTVRLAEFWGDKFEGLYDFVYEKTPKDA